MIARKTPPPGTDLTGLDRVEMFKRHDGKWTWRVHDGRCQIIAFASFPDRWSAERNIPSFYAASLPLFQLDVNWLVEQPQGQPA